MQGERTVGVALERPRGKAIVLLGARQLPDDDGLVAAGREDEVGVFDGSGDGGDPAVVADELPARRELFSHGWTRRRGWVLGEKRG